MSVRTNLKRVRVNSDLEAVIEESVKQNRPVILEGEHSSYTISPRRVVQDTAYEERLYFSPYTVESVYGSLPSLMGRPSSDVSDEELEQMIEKAKEENARQVIEGMAE